MLHIGYIRFTHHISKTLHLRRHREAKAVAKKPASAPTKLGRPSSFNEALSARILELAKQGKTDAQMANAIGVTQQTFDNWKHKHPDFFGSLKACKSVADELVEVSLYQRATGYSHPEEKIYFHPKTGEMIREVVIKHYPPDTTAMIFWLKNRQKDRWRDVHHHEAKHTFENLTDEELIRIVPDAVKMLEGK